MRSILGIDTASPRGSVALLVDGAEAGFEELPAGGHSNALASACEKLVRASGVAFSALSGIAVSRGPGSFTGLRIGLAWAKGVAVAAGVPLALVSAHEAAALAGGEATGLRATLTPGERNEVEIALWDERRAGADSPGRPALLVAATSVPELDIAERLSALAGGRAVVALPANEAIAALLDEDGIPRRETAPLALSVAKLGDSILQSGESSDVVHAAPEYGRAPNARKPRE